MNLSPFATRSFELIKRLGLDAAGFLYPLQCLNCQRPLPNDQKITLCSPCQTSLCGGSQNACLRCSASIGPYLTSKHGCYHCQKDQPIFENAVSLGAYSGPLQKICVQSKTSRLPVLTIMLARLLCEYRSQQLADWQVDVVVPIPLHWQNRLLTTLHGPDEIARIVASFLKVPYDGHILSKVKRTTKQHRLNASARRSNLQGAFSVNKTARLHGVRILLIDDVLTTCTTANRATRVLLDAGAASVNVAVLARTLHK